MNWLWLTLAAAVAPGALASPSASPPAPCRLGDTVKADIVTPVSLVVVDAEATVALREKEAAKVPVFFLYRPEAAGEVERDFRAAFSAVRSNFFDAMADVYQRKRLNPQWLNSPRFTTLSATFRRQHRGFPQLTNLIELWALGQPDDAIEDAQAALLRAAMEHFIRGEPLPAELKLGAQVRLVTASNGVETLTLEAAEKSAFTLARTNLLPLRRIRTEVQQSAPPGEGGKAGYLASFLKPNCIALETITAQARDRHVSALLVADRYEAGQRIAQRGQAVDAKLLAALDQLNKSRAAPPPVEKTTVAMLPWLYRLNPWHWTGLGLLSAGLVFVAWRLVNRKKPVSLLPARVAGDGAAAGIITCPACDENIVVPTAAVENLAAGTPGWRGRALAAEAKADQARAALRAGVLPQLTDWLKQKFVQGLMADRSRMVSAQRTAAADLAALEQRLDELHAPLQERLRAYEKRIAELEQLLAAKGEENRELLRAKIQMTRRQLETARARNPMALN